MFGSIKRKEASVEEMFAPAQKQVDKDYNPLNDAAKTSQSSEDNSPMPSRPSDEELDRVFAEGKAAKAEGKALENNPYDGQMADVWVNGFTDT